jgi:biopolymer transport protein ExbB
MSISGIMQAFNEGGIFMYCILAFGLFTVAFIAERANALFFKMKDAPANFRDQMLQSISKGDLLGARNLAQSVANSSNSPLARIAIVGAQLRANGAGDDELQSRMDEALSREISNLDRRTGFLGMFGNVATLLGLLGTIVGMIHSFGAVASASPADRATLLSKGISEAMNCTAFGLIVAIPALVAYAIFQNKTDKAVTALTENTTEIFNDLLFLSESDSASDSESVNTNRQLGAGRSASRPAPTLSV